MAEGAVDLKSEAQSKAKSIALDDINVADPELWRAALRVGHGMGRKAISRPGAVAGLVRLGRLRAVVDALRKRAR